MNCSLSPSRFFVTFEGGLVTIKADYARLLGKNEKRICQLIKTIVRDIIDRASADQDLEDAIKSTDTSFGSPVMELQQYVASESCTEWGAPDLCKLITQEAYDKMVSSEKEFIRLGCSRNKNGVIDNFSIHYQLTYHDACGREMYYAGKCEIQISRFKRISRRQNRRKAA